MLFAREIFLCVFKCYLRFNAIHWCDNPTEWDEFMSIVMCILQQARENEMRFELGRCADWLAATTDMNFETEINKNSNS